MTKVPQPHWVFNAQQIQALSSSVRQRMMDRIEAVGPSSVRQLAASLGYAHDALYYHIKVLLKAELVRAVGTQPRARRDEALYDVINPNWQIGYALADASNVRAICSVAKSMLKQAFRDFEAGCSHPLAETDGSARNLWTLRLEARLSATQREQIQAHLQGIFAILRSAKTDSDDPLHAVTWAIAPIPENPDSTRRTP